ncbi:HIT family protein [Cohnella abietis]|uniref:HIT domain-containing protein n=1 Tax=Cohnella abietis TaxID=2507935 RepID=A0A3T1CY76_9BACL|nr:hypothetical protein [Cohnella abietis]BBI30796.1 hypothetical protein KCTCHS21_01950 [Cohnella abietis]
MTNDHNCRFCKVADPVHFGKADTFWDRPLLETKHFFVVPSLGPLVEGWLLIVTKEHHICMGSLDKAETIELKQLLDTTSSLVRSIYGPIAVFEHGPVESKLPVGCGVDHAHIHVVPVLDSLIEAASQWCDTKFVWDNVSGIEAVRTPYMRSQSYLYIHQDGFTPMLYDGIGIPSQLFRRAIAGSLGIADRYNWRENANESVIAKTIERITPALQQVSPEELIRYGGGVVDRAFDEATFRTID